MDELFGEVISEYTDKEGIEDGFLIDLSSFKTKINRGTRNLLESKKYIDGDKLNVPCIIDLLNQCIYAINKGKARESIQIEFPDGSKGKVWVAENEINGYTVMLPEDY